MLLLELAHVDGGHVLLAAVEQVGQRPARSRSCRRREVPTNRNTPIGLRGSVEAGAAGADRLGDRLQRVGLADDALLQRAPSAFSTVLISSETMRPTGMPVQAATTSATAWPSTTRMHQRRPRPAACAARRWRCVSSACSAAASAAAVVRRVRRSRLDALAQLADARDQRLLLAPSASPARRARPRSGVALRLQPRSAARRGRRRAAVSRADGAELGGDQRRAGAARSSTGAGDRRLAHARRGRRRCRAARRLVRQLPGRDVAGRELAPPRRPPRRGCGRCGASPASATRPRSIALASGSTGLLDLDHLEAAGQRRRPSRSTSCIRPRWWPRRCAARRAPAPA